MSYSMFYVSLLYTSVSTACPARRHHLMLGATTCYLPTLTSSPFHGQGQVMETTVSLWSICLEWLAVQSLMNRHIASEIN